MASGEMISDRDDVYFTYAMIFLVVSIFGEVNENLPSEGSGMF